MVTANFRAAHGPQSVLGTKGNEEAFNDLYRANGDALVDQALFTNFIARAAGLTGAHLMSPNLKDGQSQAGPQTTLDA